ncbi:uncharacterized protein BT62DRAFT_762215 [Guyanagaster necrorhizus]|uniref:Uncharacterized protein n=1 Tax=Guyanagaster necrorhizus TaxID=856835 RepID=A0A9P7VXY5_9AGAR|nr:uncharacterized protein BT62DRAFT_762215 [Guyanagaster necrorhizus MCA 3950]KAG7448259.1 hypothetical protein BT62DRAFT_762215 [Guyanagaster necrorhizus MCA 3950]
MAGQYPPPDASATGHANINGALSGYRHGMVQLPSGPHLPVGYVNGDSMRNQPMPHLHPYYQQSEMGPDRHHQLYAPQQQTRYTAYAIAQTRSLPNLPHHTTFPPTEYNDAQRYQQQPGNTLPAGTFPDQGGLAFPPSQRHEPHHIPPNALPMQHHPPFQGQVPSHQRAGSIYQYPDTRPRQMHDASMPHQPYPQAYQVHGPPQPLRRHHTSAPLQPHPQQVQPMLPVPPDMPGPSQPPKSVQASRKNKRRASGSQGSARRKPKIETVPLPSSPYFPMKRRRGRPTRAETEARKKALAASIPSEAASAPSPPKEPSTSQAPQQSFNPPPPTRGIWPIPFSVSDMPKFY